MSELVAEYTIALGGSAYDLEKEVSALIAEGWRPHGSLICVDGGEQGLHFYQALVR